MSKTVSVFRAAYWRVRMLPYKAVFHLKRWIDRWPYGVRSFVDRHLFNTYEFTRSAEQSEDAARMRGAIAPGELGDDEPCRRCYVRRGEHEAVRTHDYEGLFLYTCEGCSPDVAWSSDSMSEHPNYDHDFDWIPLGMDDRERPKRTEQAYRAPQSVLDLIDIGLTFVHAGSNRGDCKEHFGIDDCVRCLTEKAATDLGLPTEPKRDCDACLRPVATLEGHSVHVNGVAFWLHPECETFVRKVIDAANPPKAAVDA